MDMMMTTDGTVPKKTAVATRKKQRQEKTHISQPTQHLTITIVTCPLHHQLTKKGRKEDGAKETSRRTQTKPKTLRGFVQLRSPCPRPHVSVFALGRFQKSIRWVGFVVRVAHLFESKMNARIFQVEFYRNSLTRI
jgi:hypothetical protein